MVRGRDVLSIPQGHSRDYVVEIVVGVTQSTHIVPDNRLSLVGAATNNLSRSSGDAFMTDGGVDVVTADKKAFDDGRGTLAGAEEMLEGGVGGERKEEARSSASW